MKSLHKFKEFNENEYQKNLEIISQMEELNTTTDKYKAAEIATNLRKKLLIIINSKAFQGIERELNAYRLLIDIANIIPLNNIDVFSFKKTDISKSFFCSSGHQFSIAEAINFILFSGNIINVITTEELHVLDVLHLCLELEKRNIHYDKQQFLSVFFNKFFKYVKADHYYFMKLVFFILPVHSNIRQDWCSFLLCQIAETGCNDMKFFEFVYKNAKIEVNYLHKWPQHKDLDDKKSRFNFDEKYGKRLINIAAIYGHSDIVKFLLQQGAALDLYTVNGELRTVLFDTVHGEKLQKGKAVCSHGYEKITNLLLDAKVDPFIKINSLTAIEYAWMSAVCDDPQPWSYIDNMPLSDKSDACYDVLDARLPVRGIKKVLHYFLWTTETLAENLGQSLGLGVYSSPF